mmetsp:Transcript_16282/g.39366  ORF Transcript_16282/g.39366 Transcript_16282/m.39366 type:complete len:219 (+) Transcript_16282:77-733(+)
MCFPDRRPGWEHRAERRTGVQEDPRVRPGVRRGPPVRVLPAVHSLRRAGRDVGDAGLRDRGRRGGDVPGPHRVEHHGRSPGRGGRADVRGDEGEVRGHPGEGVRPVRDQPHVLLPVRRGGAAGQEVQHDPGGAGGVRGAVPAAGPGGDEGGAVPEGGGAGPGEAGAGGVPGHARRGRGHPPHHQGEPPEAQGHAPQRRDHPGGVLPDLRRSRGGDDLQ